MSTSDLRDFWFALDHADRPGVELLELEPVDLRDVEVEMEVEEVEDVVKPTLGAKILLVGLSSAFNADVMLLELSDVPRVFWSWACRLGDGSNGMARLDKVEGGALLVAVGLVLAGFNRSWRGWCGGRRI